jgi:hypothetical protein
MNALQLASIGPFNPETWQMVAGVSVGRSVRRGRKYTRRAAKFPYQDIGRTGGTVRPGEYLVYQYADEPTHTPEVAQFVGHVSADADGPNVPRFRGLAVITFSPQTGALFERWIMPRDIVRTIPAAGLRLFSQGE